MALGRCTANLSLIDPLVTYLASDPHTQKASATVQVHQLANMPFTRSVSCSNAKKTSCFFTPPPTRNQTGSWSLGSQRLL